MMAAASGHDGTTFRALITGAASGIGRATAERIARDRKCILLLVDANESGLSEVARSLTSDRCAPHVMRADLANSAHCAGVVSRAAETMGGIDALISVAGIVTPVPLADAQVEDFDRAFAINTRATWLLARDAYPYLRSSRGSIVAVASIAASHPAADLGFYSASKAAVSMLARQMADEWGSVGIRSNSVSPGAIRTPMTQSSYGTEIGRAARSRGVGLRRVGEPEEIAAVIAFLVSNDASYISGDDVLVDGGMGAALLRVSRGTGESLTGERR